MVNFMLTQTPQFEHAQLMDPFDSNHSTFYFLMLNTGNNITHKLAVMLRKGIKVCETINKILSSEVFSSIY